MNCFTIFKKHGNQFLCWPFLIVIIYVFKSARNAFKCFKTKLLKWTKDTGTIEQFIKTPDAPFSKTNILQIHIEIHSIMNRLYATMFTMHFDISSRLVMISRPAVGYFIPIKQAAVPLDHEKCLTWPPSVFISPRDSFSCSQLVPYSNSIVHLYFTTGAECD